MAAIESGQMTIDWLEGNVDKGTYALRVRLPEDDLTDEAFIVVKRCGQTDQSFRYMHVSSLEKKLRQRDCDQAEIDAAKTKINDYTPRELTKVSENCYSYRYSDATVWKVQHLAQPEERFLVDSSGSEAEMIFPDDLLIFKAILGLENFDAGYIKEYSNPSRD